MNSNPMNPSPMNPNPMYAGHADSEANSGPRYVDVTFTEPPATVDRARLAIARLEHHLFRAIGPMDVGCELSALAGAVLELEDVRPPYPPLPPDIEASKDPRADLDLAIDALNAAGADGVGVVDILRFAYAIRHLREIEESPYLRLSADTEPRTGL